MTENKTKLAKGDAMLQRLTGHALAAWNCKISEHARLILYLEVSYACTYALRKCICAGVRPESPGDIVEIQRSQHGPELPRGH